MRRKKRDPLGSSMRWERGLSRSVSTRSPSLYHSTVGAGRPSALQLRVAGSPLDTMRSEGCSTMRGGESSWRRRDPGEEEGCKGDETDSRISSRLVYETYCICKLGTKAHDTKSHSKIHQVILPCKTKRSSTNQNSSSSKGIRHGTLLLLCKCLVLTIIQFDNVITTQSRVAHKVFCFCFCSWNPVRHRKLKTTTLTCELLGK